jgi:hypothetical protein
MKASQENLGANFVYIDFSGKDDSEMFVEGGRLKKRFSNFDFSYARNKDELKRSFVGVESGKLPYFWLKGDVNGYKNLGTSFPVADLNSCMVICEEPLHESHYMIGQESNSPFFYFGRMSEDVQSKCWDYFCDITGTLKPSAEDIFNGSHDIRGMHVLAEESFESAVNVFESAYATSVEKIIQSEVEKQMALTLKYGRVSMTHHIASLSRIVNESFPSFSDSAQARVVSKLLESCPKSSVIELEGGEYYFDVGLGVGFDKEEFEYLEKIEGNDRLLREVKK